MHEGHDACFFIVASVHAFVCAMGKAEGHCG